MKSYSGFSRKSWADRTWSSWVTSVTYTLVGKTAQQCTSHPSGSWNTLTPATDVGCTDKEQCTAQFTAHEPRRLDNNTTNVTLEQTNHSSGEFTVLLSTLKTSCRSKT